jgi:hypothetical protein
VLQDTNGVHLSRTANQHLQQPVRDRHNMWVACTAAAAHLVSLPVVTPSSCLRPPAGHCMTHALVTAVLMSGTTSDIRVSLPHHLRVPMD